MHQPSASQPLSTPRVTPALPVHIFTFINSLGTGVVTNGIFFLTKSAYDFSERHNYLLALALGLSYMAGALCAGKLSRALHGMGERAALIGVLIVLTACCTVPIGVARFASASDGAWVAWVLVLVYSPTSAILWPLVESYLSGGRSGTILRSTLGTWNVVWSSALVVSFFAIAPAVEKHAREAIFGLGFAHVISVVPLLTFPKRAAEHVHDAAPRELPPHAAQLLTTFRVLLPTSYVLTSALSPALASLLPKLGVSANVQTIAASAWLIPRVVVFALLGVWHKWEWRWWPAVAGYVLMLGGFVLALLSSPALDAGLTRSGALAMLLSGLAFLGAGLGVIYTGAIMYAMEVGDAQVDAGGAHEGLIGLGYSVGPLCGLIGAQSASSGALSPAQSQTLVVILVLCITLSAGLWLLRRLQRLSGARVPIADA